jgi:hydrogenase-1 operon protein HyaF
MNQPQRQQPFPIPVVAALGPGSQPPEEEVPDLLAMPRDMATYNAPPLPEPEELRGHDQALAVLRQAQAALAAWQPGQAAQVIDLGGLAEPERRLLNQVLGEGEVAAQVQGATPGQPAVQVHVQVQESVFAGVWRVLHHTADGLLRDTLEVGPIPEVLRLEARADGAQGRSVGMAAPADLMNAPALLEELRDQQRRWQPGQAQHVVNLTLLPLTTGDSLWLDAHLGAGRVLILSRGYGNCRIVDTWQPRTWRVTYFNSTDIIILDTLEVGDVPEVALAAPEDLADSAERLAEVLHWVEGAPA